MEEAGGKKERKRGNWKKKRWIMSKQWILGCKMDVPS
jgi:hypothetical protein